MIHELYKTYIFKNVYHYEVFFGIFVVMFFKSFLHLLFK